MPTRTSPDLAAAAEACWQLLAPDLDSLLDRQNRVLLAVSGGQTPLELFRHMAATADHPRWRRTDFCWVDERCVAPDHPDNNFHQAMRWLAILPAGFHRIDTTLPPAAAARSYERTLADLRTAGPTDAPDIALLGMGTDGHYASLFPDTEALRHTGGRNVLENYVPTLDSWRVTLTAPYLRRCRYRYLLAGGHDKLAVLAAAAEHPEHYPVGQLLPPRPDDRWCLYR